jgi:ribosomal protein S18 acetylase RimI-like enzyme
VHRLTCIDLGSLAVDPDFSGRGIATQLVQWGINKAEEDNVPAFLEASPAALGLYKRLGFVVVREAPALIHNLVLTIMVKDVKA